IKYFWFADHIMTFTGVPTWFETLPSTSKEADDVVAIWEGVAAVNSKSSPLRLYKIVDDDVFQLTLPHENVKVISDGYWTCAEIRGRFESGDALTYHAESPQKADTMITAISELMGSSLREIVVRLDPDPLRLLDALSITARLDEWTDLCRNLAEKWTIVFDSNMPL
ncbi:hypothetical protein PMAYCL1PPCAC_04739, partial [Pristionchus mayeri]